MTLRPAPDSAGRFVCAPFCSDLLLAFWDDWVERRQGLRLSGLRRNFVKQTNTISLKGSLTLPSDTRASIGEVQNGHFGTAQERRKKSRPGR